MHDNWQEAIERIERYAMPVASDKARKAASKQTWRSKPDSFLRERQICDIDYESPVCSFVNEFTDDGVLVSQQLVADLTGDYLMAKQPGELF